MDFECSNRGWFANAPDFERDLEAQPFEIQTNGRHCQNHLRSGQKNPDFELSSYQMVGTIALAKA